MVIDHKWIDLVTLKESLIFLANCQIFMIKIDVLLQNGLFLLLQFVTLSIFFKNMDFIKVDKWSSTLIAIFIIVVSHLRIHCLLCFQYFLFLDSLLSSKPILSNLLLSFEPFLLLSFFFLLLSTSLLTLYAEFTHENEHENKNQSSYYTNKNNKRCKTHRLSIIHRRHIRLYL